MFSPGKNFALCAATICLFLSLIFLTDQVLAIKMKDIDFPDSVIDGSSVQLRCDYDLEGEKLYSISWFKDGAEIYRYMTLAKNKKRSYSMKGVEVDINKSDDYALGLKNFTKESQGLYKCEVITDWTFKSIEYEKKINVEKRSFDIINKPDHHEDNTEDHDGNLVVHEREGPSRGEIEREEDDRVDEVEREEKKRGEKIDEEKMITKERRNGSNRGREPERDDARRERERENLKREREREERDHGRDRNDRYEDEDYENSGFSGAPSVILVSTLVNLLICSL